MKKAESLSEVRDQCCQLASDVMNNPKVAMQVHEAANALGKAIKACTVHLEQCALQKKSASPEWAKFIG